MPDGFLDDGLVLLKRHDSLSIFRFDSISNNYDSRETLTLFTNPYNVNRGFSVHLLARHSRLSM